MKPTRYPILAIAMCALLSLAACDPLSSVDYKIHNMTDDTVTVTFYREIMRSSYQGYTIEENDSVSTRYQGDSSMVAILPPGQRLGVQYGWSGLYREELIVPLWRYIKTITVADNELDSLKWGYEQAWHLKTQGGGFGEGESRYYDLYLRQK